MTTERSYTLISVEDQRKILQLYQKGVRGRGYVSISKQVGRSPSSVAAVVSRLKRNNNEPSTARGHKKRKLSFREEQKIDRLLENNCLNTNPMLASAVHNKIAIRTVSDYTQRTFPPFTKKAVSYRDPDELEEGWTEEVNKFVKKLRYIPLDDRIYADETPIYANDSPSRGRSRKGTRAMVAKKFRSDKYNLHVYASRREVVYWELTPDSGTDETVTKIALRAVRRMKPSKVLIWDQLGKGNAYFPKLQHYNPRISEAIGKKNGKVLILPCKGKYLNPVELLFNDLKEHHLRPAIRHDGEPSSLRRLGMIIRRYMKNQAPTNLPGFFRERANGRDLQKVQSINIG